MHLSFFCKNCILNKNKEEKWCFVVVVFQTTKRTKSSFNFNTKISSQEKEKVKKNAVTQIALIIYELIKFSLMSYLGRHYNLIERVHTSE